MNKSSWRISELVLVGVLLAGSMVAFAEEAGSAKEVQNIKLRLEGVREEMVSANDEFTLKNREYSRFHDGIVYSNKLAGKIYSSILELEKTLRQKRKELSDLTDNLPEMRRINKERESLYANVRDLRERERLILKEFGRAKIQEKHKK